jgi:signal transduction histidine kinase
MEREIEFFCDKTVIASLEREIEQSGDNKERISKLIILAWHLRESDSERSLAILSEVWQFQDYLLDEKNALFVGYAKLTAATIAIINLDGKARLENLYESYKIFKKIGNEIGIADTFVIAMCMLVDEDKIDRYIKYFEISKEIFERNQSYDRLVFLISTAQVVIGKVYSLEKLLFYYNKSTQSNCCNFMMHRLDAWIDYKNNDLSGSIKKHLITLQYGEHTNIIFYKFYIHLIIGVCFANLYDLPSALEWKEKSYQLSQKLKIKRYIFASMSSYAETLTSIGQYKRARDIFNEIMAYADTSVRSLRKIIFYCAVGSLDILQGWYVEGLEHFSKAYKAAENTHDLSFQQAALSGKARCLSRLGRHEDAIAAAVRGCAICRDHGYTYYEVEAQQALAEVLRAADGDKPHRAIEALERALALGERIEGLMVKADIFFDLAKDYAALGDYQRALSFEIKGRESWQRNFDKENAGRVAALQVRYDTARAQAEADHNRALAEAEVRRAQAMEESNATLALLGDIGQQITASLDQTAIFASLYEHLDDLLPMQRLSVAVPQEGGTTVLLRWRTADGVPPQCMEIATDDPGALATCLRSGGEQLSLSEPSAREEAWCGAPLLISALVFPLRAGDRLIGSACIESDRSTAYGLREQFIFRSLCAYAAVALANASAYASLDRAHENLRSALDRLVQQEKMAALGQLVSGVAHEVNTPLGISLSSVSLLHDNIVNLSDKLKAGNLTRSALQEHLESGKQLTDLIQRNLNRASSLVQNFKEVAIDHTKDDLRSFALDEYLQEIITLFYPKLSEYALEVHLEAEPVPMRSYPGALAQTLSCLIDNIIAHAYAGAHGGKAMISTRRFGMHHVDITVKDCGAGILPEILPKAFDPFVTTGRNQGHMGLGLHAAFNQVTQKLQGQISLENNQDEAGVTVRLRLPLRILHQA